MKLEIYFLNSKLTTEIKKDIQVKDLLFDLKEYLNTTDSNFILYDKNHIQLKESDIISIKKEKQLVLYLMKSVPNKNSLTNIEKKDNLAQNLKATELIMKCTNANKSLDLKKRIATNNRITLLDIFDNRNNEPQGENSGFDRLLNILQVLEENNMGLRIGNINSNNNAPVEADEQALRELQDMGFPEDRARQALINSRNDINRATELLLGEVGD